MCVCEREREREGERERERRVTAQASYESSMEMLSEGGLRTFQSGFNRWGQEW